VNVVPGDQAAGRIPDPRVRNELTYLEVQDAKRRAAEALREGRRGDALAAYSDADGKLSAAMACAPSAELDEEARIMTELRERTEARDDQYVAKLARMEHARKSRKRGRGD